TPATAQYAGGNGDPNTPFLIETAEQLNSIGLYPEHWGKHFQLIADIDLAQFSGTEFNLIGDFINPGDRQSFSGSFDGNNYKITHFNFSDPSINKGIALFTSLEGQNASIKNLTLQDPCVDAQLSTYVGSLIGYMFSGSVHNCHVYGGTVKGRTALGGLISNNANGKITNCSTDMHVYGNNEAAGGLVGSNRGDIINCYATGPVHGVQDIGGLVGANYGGTINDSYATGDITGTFWCVGGLAGTNDGDIYRSYATGNVFSTHDDIGGLVGTFIDVGWDFVGPSEDDPNDYWRMCVDDLDYPKLSWQSTPGDLLCPDGVGLVDFAYYCAHWLDAPCDDSNNYCYRTDLNHDGRNNLLDYLILAQNYLKN
ncbi:MAG: hypothetical protein GY869_15130, partial [Planctomycetes bacterium]|nr:hypothetical protein [Planctomycetota bacterium]